MGCAESYTRSSGELCCSIKEQDVGGFPAPPDEDCLCTGNCRFFLLEEDPEDSEEE